MYGKTACPDGGSVGSKDSKNVLTKSSGQGMELLFCSCINLETSLFG